MALIVWAVIGAGAVFLHRTTYGRAIYAIGNRERAAYLSGIDTQRVVMFAFAISGGLSAFGGVLLAGYASKAAQAMGDASSPALDRRRGARRHLDPRRPRLLSRHGRRRDPDHLAAIDPVGDADGGVRRQVIYGVVIIAMLLLYGRERLLRWSPFALVPNFPLSPPNGRGSG
jgi:ribose transport system permease protein